MSRRKELDLERDIPLDTEDLAALDRARRTRFDPSELEWQWISLASQFRIRQSRKTADGREEFRLPP